MNSFLNENIIVEHVCNHPVNESNEISLVHRNNIVRLMGNI